MRKEIYIFIYDVRVCGVYYLFLERKKKAIFDLDIYDVCVYVCVILLPPLSLSLTSHASSRARMFSYTV
jgi:hypothetical protein